MSLRAVMVPVEVALLFLATINLHRWSSLALVALFGWAVIRWCARAGLDLAFAMRLLLLVVFVSVFLVTYAPVVGEEATTEPFTYALKYSLPMIAFYVIGYSAGLDDPSAQIWKLLGLAGGFVLFAYLSAGVAADQGLTLVPEVADRAAPSYWGDNALLSGTGLGAFASLGMCLLPAAFARTPDGVRRTTTLPWRGLVVATAVAGALTNLSLQNRTPLIAFVGALLAARVLTLDLRRASRMQIAASAAVLSALVAVAVEIRPILEALEPHLGVARRFMDQGVETSRYEAWLAVIGSLTRYPSGGHMADLAGHAYAHNMWLDVAVDAGVPTLALLLAFHAIHLGAVRRLFHGDAPQVVRVALIGLVVSFLATFMVEPVVQTFRITYFGASFYILANASALAARESAARESAASESAASESAAALS
jgi:hypothetical protein